MFLSRYQFLQQIELEEFAREQTVFTESNPCNIYFILKRPRLSLDPKYLRLDSGRAELKYFIQIEDEKFERYLLLELPRKIHNIRLESKYPYNYFKLHDDNLESPYIKLAAIVNEAHKHSGIQEPLLDYQILYIGQAFGEDGKRTALDRLGSHSTLQKIYSEAMDRNPDSEIWLMLAAFTEKKIGLLNGMINISVSNEKEDSERFINFMTSTGSSFSEKQKVNFTEAALIRTFLPQYNKEYKDTFPNPAHASYSECYDLDINAIVVETDTSEIKRWLYTDDKPRTVKETSEYGFPFWQYGKFYFINSEDRYKMFNHDYI